MIRPQRPRRSSAVLGLAHILQTALPFLRNVALVRLMEPREFALSLTLSTIVAIAELTTDFGANNYAVKIEDQDRRSLDTLHAIAVLRAALAGAALALLAVPLAYLFDASGAAAAFALCGLAIAIKGFSQLGIKQVGRQGNFMPEALTIIVSQSVWSIALVLMALIWPDHRAAIAGLLAYAVTFVATSHVLTHTRYRFGWDKGVARKVMLFGRPLILNGVALAITSLGDRIVVGSRLGLDTLALYGPLTTTAAVPRGTALTFVANLSMPKVIKAIEAGGSGREAMRGWTATINLLGIAFALGYLGLAAPAIGLVFGAAYEPSASLTTLMGLLLFCRILITCPVPLSIATNQTWLITSTSFIAAISLLPASLSLILFGLSTIEGLTHFLGVMVVVETIGLGIIVARTRKAFPAATVDLTRMTVLGGIIVYGSALACHIPGLDGPLPRLAFAAAGIAAGLFLYARPAYQFLFGREHVAD